MTFGYVRFVLTSKLFRVLVTNIEEDMETLPDYLRSPPAFITTKTVIVITEEMINSTSDE